MSLLELARGPLWTGSIAVFALGVAWRLFALWRIGRKPDLSAPRVAGTAGAAVRTVFARMLPRAGFHPSATLITMLTAAARPWRSSPSRCVSSIQVEKVV